MPEPLTFTPVGDDDGPNYIGMLVTLVSLACVGVFHYQGMTLPFMISSVVLISVVIWQVCDPFADAAQWVGDQLEIPGSVRGATLDAIASSMPELFTGIFFVLVALTAASPDAAAQSHAGAEGYGSAIATCAGSAVYNMILIPAACAIFISFARPSRPTIDVEDEVIKRDGMWFLGCELALLIFLYQPQMEWWMGVAFLVAYVVYILHLYIDAKRHRRRLPVLRSTIEELGATATVEEIQGALALKRIRVSKVMVMKHHEQIHSEDDDDDGPDEAGVFFGLASIPMSHATAWPLLAICTALAAGACYFLVEMTNGLATELQVPTFFVAVIVAAAASSVPDTFLSIGAARRGDDDGAVSNAFGSNIFDICICLSIPLLVNSYLTGWEPVSLLQDGKPIPGLTGLRILLWSLSLITLLVIWHKRQLTRTKAIFLIFLYAIFVTYAVVGSLENQGKAEQNHSVNIPANE